MKMAKLREMVSDIQANVRKRNEKIKARLAELDKEYSSLEISVKSLTNQLIQLEIEGNSSGQKELSQRIKDLKEDNRSIVDKREAYLSTLNDDSFVKAELPKLFAAAREEEKARGKAIEVNRQKREKLEKEIKKLQGEVEFLSRESDNLRNMSEAKALIPLLKYIETRPIKNYFIESYIQARIGGVTGELLEQYLETVEEAPGPQNLCFRTVIHPNYETSHVESLKEENAHVAPISTPYI